MKYALCQLQRYPDSLRIIIINAITNELFKKPIVEGMIVLKLGEVCNGEIVIENLYFDSLSCHFSELTEDGALMLTLIDFNFINLHVKNSIDTDGDVVNFYRKLG